MRKSVVLLCAIAGAGLPMIADGTPVPVDWHGYIRAGSGLSTKGGEQAAFQLPGAPTKYRFGNEAENYGELEIDSKVWDKDGAVFTIHTMAQFVNHFAQGSGAQGTDSPSATRDFDMAQYWVEGSGILGDSDALKGASLWAGKRYYNRHHVEIIDYFYWNNQGNGFGIENINLGFGKLNYAWMQVDNSNNLAAAPAPGITGQNATISHDLRLSDLKVNPGGTLSVGLEFTQAKPYSSVSLSNSTATAEANNNGGVAFILEHTQSGLLGGDNVLAVQYGTGSASPLGSTPDPSLVSGNKTTRVVDTLTIQPVPMFAVQAVGVYQKSQDNNSNTATWTSLGARPMVFLTDHFSVVVDAGMDRVKYPANYSPALAANATGQMVKTTVALVWRPEMKFFSVPQIRLFATNASWNDAANNAGTIANGTFPGKTSGGSYGVQGEFWW